MSIVIIMYFVFVIVFNVLARIHCMVMVVNDFKNSVQFTIIEMIEIKLITKTYSSNIFLFI